MTHQTGGGKIATVALGLVLLFAAAAIRDQSVVENAQARGELTWRQNEILVERAQTHRCTDTLGRARFRVEQRIITGGPAYRRWVLNLWRGRARLYCKAAADYQRPQTSWAAIQIHYATLIARASSRDPWPNCPDPYDGSGASWDRTVACENAGSWLDSPGYYRCGLQFDPMWERHYGRRFCP